MIQRGVTTVKTCMMAHAVLSGRQPLFSRPPRMGRRAAAVTRQMDRLSAAPPEILIHRVAAARDRAAFQSLFEYFAPRIKAYLARSGTSPQQADDLAQEAMLSVWRKAHLFDPAKASAATWIFTIARNLRIDLIRRERHPGFDPADPSLVPGVSDSPDMDFQTRQSGQRIRQALASLPSDQARIILMSFYSDKTHSEIASELDIPLGTVKSRIRLAMVRLKSLLGDVP
jgi:RNA polymerase sigma factor (sigma-70 family)